MTDTEIQTFIRYIWAMSLVPKRKIIKVWEDFIIENQLEADEEDNEEAVQLILTLDSLVEKVYLDAKSRDEAGNYYEGLFKLSYLIL